jgi:hypothetical protein
VAAERLLYFSEMDLRNFPIHDLKWRIMGPHPGKCINPAVQIAKGHLVSDTDALWDIERDLDGAAADRIVDAAHKGLLLYLVKLPRPVLGALDHCVVHSLFASVCTSIAHSILEQHSAEMVSDFEQKYAYARARVDAENCVLLGLAGIATAKHP